VRRLSLIVALILPSVAAAEARSADLDKISRLVFDQRYEAAARALEGAWRQSGTRRDLVLRILELQGVVYAQLGQEAKARAAFRELLSLDPRRDLTGKYTGRPLKVFIETQAWLQENPPLELSAEQAAVDAKGKVLQIAVKVKNDGLKLGKKVKFGVRPEGGKWSDQEVEIQGSYASAGTDAEGVEWYAELLGERDLVLAQVGSQRAPVREGSLRDKELDKEVEPPAVTQRRRDEEPAVAPDKPERKRDAALEPSPRPEPEPAVVTAKNEGSPGTGTLIRGVGYTSLGLGVASVVAGTVVGAIWLSTKNDLQYKLDNATRVGNAISDLPGVPHGSAQTYYFAALDKLRTEAMVANVLWAAGSGVAIVGVVLALLGRESADGSGGPGGLAFVW
jgi:hypothetical protein